MSSCNCYSVGYMTYYSYCITRVCRVVVIYSTTTLVRDTWPTKRGLLAALKAKLRPGHATLAHKGARLNTPHMSSVLMCVGSINKGDL